MATETKHLLSPEQYLAIERKAEVRSEFYRGEMREMAGGTRAHSLINVNILRQLASQFEGRPCEVYVSDMRLKVSATGMYTYPDVTVACGEIQFEDDQVDTLLNPTVIFEVLRRRPRPTIVGRSGRTIARSSRCANICWCRRICRAWSITCGRKREAGC